MNLAFKDVQHNLGRFSLTAVGIGMMLMIVNHTSSFKARRRAAELLDEFGVLERSYDKPSRLSGGEQQRVAIARALANNPAVILADEPTAALDSHRAKQVMELFAKIAHEQNAGVIVVTHDHRYLEVFDTIFEIEDGVLRQRAAVAT